MAKSATQQSHEAGRNVVRSGEGTQINVATTNSVGTDGRTAVSLAFNLQDAPVPDRRYAADFLTLLYEDELVKIIFGQKKLGGGIRSLVIIAMHTTDATVFLNSFDPGMDEVINHIAGMQVPTLSKIEAEPDQTIALSANYVAIASAGRASCFDFYTASAFSLANAGKTSKLAVEPVVRIDISVGYVVALRRELLELQPSFPVDPYGVKNVLA